MRIIGIDPGYRNTGFGVIEVSNHYLKYITSGVICTTKYPCVATRLKAILDGIFEVITNTKPNIASIEKVFVNINPQSTLLLGQARGTAISACVLNQITIAEYTALQVKQSIVGYGHANKDQVANMVKRLLKISGKMQNDASDALAIAITHAHSQKTYNI